MRDWSVCGEFGWVGFRVACFLYKINPNPRKIFAVGKSGPNATLKLFFLGLGWPWVGEFVGFVIMFTSKYVFSNPTELGKSPTP